MTIRVFVGCAASGEDAESLAVLEWSIRKHASEPVTIEYMMQSHDPESFWHGWATERWATPFSGFRWGIPAFCGYEGRAIYTDSDVIFMADVAELWRQDMKGKAVLAKPNSWRMCVSLWDCERAKAYLPPISQMKRDPRSHSVINQKFRDPAIVGHFAGHWNVLDAEGFADVRDPAIKAHHYTDMSCQVHQKHAFKRLAAAGIKHWFDGVPRPHPRPDLQALFDELLEEAEANDYPVSKYVPNAVFGPYRKASLTTYRGHA